MKPVAHEIRYLCLVVAGLHYSSPEFRGATVILSWVWKSYQNYFKKRSLARQTYRLMSPFTWRFWGPACARLLFSSQCQEVQKCRLFPGFRPGCRILQSSFF
jgi:hypothetical protein